MKTTWIACTWLLILAPALAQTPTPIPLPPPVPSAASEREPIVASGKPSEQLSRTDRKSVEELAKMNSAQITLSQLAVERASHKGVKHFAKQMIGEHEKTHKELKELAGHKGLELPAPGESSVAARLSKLSGEEFDREYMKTMVSDHRKVVSQVEKTADRASDADLKRWAESIAPTLQQHLEMAKNTENALTRK